MGTLQELLDQQSAITRQIDELKRQSKGQAIAEVKALMAEHGLTPDDIAPAHSRRAHHPSTAKKVAPKYRDKATNQSWTGRGLKPRWLSEALARGQSLADFAI